MSVPLLIFFYSDRLIKRNADIICTSIEYHYLRIKTYSFSKYLMSLSPLDPTWPRQPSRPSRNSSAWSWQPESVPGFHFLINRRSENLLQSGQQVFQSGQQFLNSGQQFIQQFPSSQNQFQTNFRPQNQFQQQGQFVSQNQFGQTQFGQNQFSSSNQFGQSQFGQNQFGQRPSGGIVDSFVDGLAGMLASVPLPGKKRRRRETTMHGQVRWKDQNLNRNTLIWASTNYDQHALAVERWDINENTLI